MDESLPTDAYKELVGQTVDLLTIIDEDGVIQYTSPSVERILGYEQGELVGNQSFTYVHPDDREEAIRTFEKVVHSSNSEETGQFDFRFKHQDGSWVWLEGRGKNQTENSINGYVVSLRDISDRKDYEQRLEHETERVQRVAGFVSHDLRNPLNVASGRLELARSECESAHLDDVTNSLERMERIIDDVLTLVREGDEAPTLDAVHLEQIANDCWGQVETGDASLTIDTTDLILADECKLRQVFENLFRNAVEHAGPEVTVTVGSMDDGFYVSDNGPGIDENIAGSLLDYGVSTKQDGTGLGLSIVQEVVRNHGWRVEVSESIEGGARFEFTNVQPAF